MQMGHLRDETSGNVMIGGFGMNGDGVKHVIFTLRWKKIAMNPIPLHLPLYSHLAVTLGLLKKVVKFST